MEKRMSRNYSEKVLPPWWLTTLMTAITLYLIAMFAITAYTGEEGWWAIAIPAILLTWATLSLTNMHYELHDTEFQAWLWPLSTKIAYSRIKKIEKIDTIPWYAGIGIHGFGKRQYFNNRYGQALVIHYDAKWFPQLVITPNDTEQFLSLLQQRCKKTEKKRKN
jgi:uncharacterized membrane protein YhaH (DUF805 family)